MRGFTAGLMGLLASMVLAGGADAQSWGRRDHGREAYRGQGERRTYDAPGFRGAPAGPASPVRPGCGEFAPCPSARFDRYRYPPPQPYTRDPQAWRRGQFLPPAYWRGQSVDPARYRLRRPPPGYGWYGVGRDAYLVQRSTGLILDTAPGAW